MFKYIKAELYKFLYRPYMYVTLGCFTASILIGIICANNFFPNDARGFIISSATESFTPILLAMLIFTVAFYEEFKDGTLKNVVSSGLSREKIFIGKFIVEAIQAFVIAGISIVIFVALTCILTTPSNEYLLSVFLVKLLTALPLFLGAIAFINVLILLIKKEAVMSFVYLGIIVSLPGIVLLLQNFVWDKFSYVGDILLTTQINKLQYIQIINGDMLKIALVGVIYIFVFTAIGLGIFKKKEIV